MRYVEPRRYRCGVSQRRFRSLLVLASVAIAGCGGSDGGPSSTLGSGDGPEHIHGLGVDSADDSLYIATHAGLFRAPAGDRKAERVSDSRHDTMGFTVAAPGLFLGSGHPDPRSKLPRLLGLVRSDDGGRTWRPMSLLGEADFHILRAAGRRVYGFDATRKRLMVSSDAGRTWTHRQPPEGLVDLAVDPDDPDHVVASGIAALYTSRDAGRTWRTLNVEHAGLLAWPGPLFVVDGTGTAWRSRDSGRRFTQVGHVGDRPLALASHDGALYVAMDDSTVKRSVDSGRSWTVRVAQ
jgi:hypothetical protein